jgi:hypothetical protein
MSREPADPQPEQGGQTRNEIARFQQTLQNYTGKSGPSITKAETNPQVKGTGYEEQGEDRKSVV